MCNRFKTVSHYDTFLGDGVDDATYGCKVVTLETSDIVDQFDVEYFYMIQGCTYANGKIYAVDGSGAYRGGNGYLRVINLATQKLEKSYSLVKTGFLSEPELISVDPADGTLYCSGGSAGGGGILMKLDLFN